MKVDGCHPPLRRGRILKSFQLGDVGETGREGGNAGDQGEPVAAYFFVLRHDEHFVEEEGDGGYEVHTRVRKSSMETGLEVSAWIASKRAFSAGSVRRFLLISFARAASSGAARRMRTQRAKAGRSVLQPGCQSTVRDEWQFYGRLRVVRLGGDNSINNIVEKSHV